MRATASILTFALTALVPAAHAQEQTVENAHRFLSTVASQGATTFVVDAGHGWGAVNARRSHCRYYSYNTNTGIRAGEHGCSGFRDHAISVDAHRLTSMTMLSTCMTQVSAPAALGRQFTQNAQGRDYWDIILPPRESTFRIDWSKAAEVKQEGAHVFVTGIRPPMRFRLASEALAVRMAYAMEFIRGSCDATAGTGF